MNTTTFIPSSFSPVNTRPSLRPHHTARRLSHVKTSTSTPRCVLTPSAFKESSPNDNETLREDLRQMQDLYVYKSPETLPGVAFVEGPATRLKQGPRKEWRKKVAMAFAQVLLNMGRTNPRILFTAGRTLLWSVVMNGNDEFRIDNALRYYTERVDKSTDAMVKALRKNFATASYGGEFEETNPVLKAFRMMWPHLKRPELADVFMEDKMFGRLRVAGYNPMSLRRVFKREDMPFDISDEDLPWTGDEIDAMINEERLYMHDFSALAAIEQDKTDVDKKFFTTSALYGVKCRGGDLEPVAIELNNEVCVRPKAGASTHEIGFWSIAKMAVNQNDAMHHEVIAHLGGTHLVMEPFVIATMRQLHRTHPLHQLLIEHFEGTLHINDRASRNLIKDGGNVDEIFAGDISSVRAFVVDHVLNTPFNSRMPDVEMKQRGVTSSMLNMPYRDDALEHYDAIKQWVGAYVRSFYRSDADIVNDVQLQQWARELTDEARGRMKGFGEDDQGNVTTRQYLIDVVSFIIFTASVQHAAVNFPQFGLMSYAPAVPGAMYGPVPRKGQEVSVRDWCAMLTPMKRSLEQIAILSVIGNIYYTRLGEYTPGSLSSRPDVRKALKKYRRRLQALEERIEAREKGAPVPYTYLMPSKVPRSINI